MKKTYKQKRISKKLRKKAVIGYKKGYRLSKLVHGDSTCAVKTDNKGRVVK